MACAAALEEHECVCAERMEAQSSLTVGIAVVRVVQCEAQEQIVAGVGRLAHSGHAHPPTLASAVMIASRHCRASLS